MENSNSHQLELFTPTNDSKEIAGSSSNKKFLDFIWNYEKAILIIIGIVSTGIISFSLGVEKGKRLAGLKNNILLDLASAQSRTAVKPAEKQVIEQGDSVQPEQVQQLAVKKTGVIRQSLPQAGKPGYTIQLASYKTGNLAQKEAVKLEKKGLSPLVLRKGSYAVLCVGNFSKKESAQSLLSELKKRYNDCYIRKL